MIYAGFTVLTEDPNRRDAVTQQANRTKTRIDSQTGPFTEVSPAQAPRGVRTFNWFMPDRPSIDAFRAFMAERAGRFTPFWVPTWHHDLQLAGDVLSPASTLNVIDIGYSRYQFDSTQTWRRHLAFIQIGVGLQFIRRIDGAVEASPVETLTLDSATASAMLNGQWMLSLLTLCRLESDSYDLKWSGRNVAECSFDIREIPQEMTPVPV